MDQNAAYTLQSSSTVCLRNAYFAHPTSVKAGYAEHSATSPCTSHSSGHVQHGPAQRIKAKETRDKSSIEVNPFQRLVGVHIYISTSGIQQTKPCETVDDLRPGNS